MKLFCCLPPGSENKHPHTFTSYAPVVDCVYMTLFSALEQTQCALVCDCEWATVAFYSPFLNLRPSGVLTALFGYMAGVTRNCCRLGARSAHTMQLCTSLQCCFVSSHTRRVHVCSCVTCHLHFWQNDQLLR